jgi:aspartyl protease family protein
MVFAACILFVGLLTWLFQGALERQHNPNISPETSSFGAVDQVVLRRNRSSHYIVSGYLNNHRVRFLVDTGATDVALSQRLAEKIGLNAGALVMLSTANGVATGYRTVIDSVVVGNIELKGISAVMSSGIDDNVVLLGMSFLKHLEMIQRDGTLLLRH